MRTSRLSVVGCVAVAVAVVGGCESRQKPQAFIPAAVTNRGVAAGEMAAAWREKRLSLDECINVAFEGVETVGSPADTAFAGAVLDFAALVEAELPHGGEYEFFWFRLGGLACASAQRAYERGDYAEARGLIFAGPRRWQTDAYWELHPNYDALASYVLFANGEGAAALSRLRDRMLEAPAVIRAREEIQAAMRK